MCVLPKLDTYTELSTEPLTTYMLAHFTLLLACRMTVIREPLAQMEYS